MTAKPMPSGKHRAYTPTMGEMLTVVSDRIRVLADSVDTGGAAFIFEDVTGPGDGPPLHRHGRDDEHFYIIEGTAKFSVDGVATTLGPGGYAHCPRGSVHAFVNSGSTALKMHITCIPGGLDMPFREADKLAKEGTLSPETLAAAFRKFDLEFVGPPLKP